MDDWESFAGEATTQVVEAPQAEATTASATTEAPAVEAILPTPTLGA